MVNKTWISFFSLKYCFFQLQWETFSRWIQHLYSDIRRSCVHLASFIPSNVPCDSICLAVLVWYRMADWIAIARAWSNEIRIILRWLMFDEEKGRWCSFFRTKIKLSRTKKCTRVSIGYWFQIWYLEPKQPISKLFSLLSL